MANTDERRGGAFRDYGAGVGVGAAGGSVSALALLKRGEKRESSYGGVTNKKGKATKRPNAFNRFVDKHTATGTDRRAIKRNQGIADKLDKPNTRNLHGKKIKSSRDIVGRATTRVAGVKRRVLGYGVLGGVALGGVAAAAYRSMKRKDPNNPRHRELNALLDDAIEFGMRDGMRKFKRNLDIGGRGMEAARRRVNINGAGAEWRKRSARARKALDMRRRARSITRGTVIGTGIGGAIGTGEALRQHRNRKKNER